MSLDVGQGGESLETIKQRALACGAVESYVVDARDEFANEYCMKALKANAMYEGVYPLVSAISRPLISKHLVRAAHQLDVYKRQVDDHLKQCFAEDMVFLRQVGLHPVSYTHLSC